MGHELVSLICLGATRGEPMGPSLGICTLPLVVLFGFLSFVVILVVQIPRRTGHRPTRPRSGPKPPCLLVPCVQAMAHGQEAREYCKLKPDGR
jgi:hypothetical protein